MFIDRTRLLLTTLLALSIFFTAGAAHAGTELMILLDASGTMTSPGTPGTSHSKFDEVRTALNELLQNLPADIAIGLRIVGGTASSDCYTSYLYMVPTPGYRSQLQDYLASIRPAGSRALYQGIEDSLADLGRSTAGIDRILLVITDGGDDCDRDFSILARTYSYSPDSPRIVIYGLDLSLKVSEDLSELVAATGGRIADLDSIQDLPTELRLFSEEFQNNLRIHLQDSSGGSVKGDVVVRNYSTNEIVAERLDISDLSITVPSGTYVVTGRYLGQEAKSDMFTLGESESRTISLEFRVYLETFTLSLRDIFDQALKARVTFINSANEPVYTTDIASVHRVELPVDIYRIQIRIGDFIHEFGGIQIGPASQDSMEIEIPVELGILEVEVTNIWGFPLNASVKIFDQDGSLMEEAPFTSYLYAHLPPGTYRVIAQFQNREIEETVNLYSGEQRQLGLELDVALGDLYIMLRTKSGNDAWGWVKVYDSHGNLLERYDRERIESPDWYLTDVPVGIYRIEAESDNVVRTESGVEVKENEETEVMIEFPDDVF